MLGLLTPTDPKWIDAVQPNLDLLFSDHAHCELKAAQSALSLIARFGGEAPEIIAPLSDLAKEETEHFYLVHEKITERGQSLSQPSSDAYVRTLHEEAKKDRVQSQAFLDRLVICSLIEARSCERFKVLAEYLKDSALKSFYKELMASEARHYRLFLSLAEGRFGKEIAKKRFQVLAEREGKIVGKLSLGPTVHG